MGLEWRVQAAKQSPKKNANSSKGAPPQPRGGRAFSQSGGLPDMPTIRPAPSRFPRFDVWWCQEALLYSVPAEKAKGLRGEAREAG